MFKGLKKAIARIPQQIRADASEPDPETRTLITEFEHFHNGLSKIKEDLELFKKSVSSYLSHQLETTKALLAVQDSESILFQALKSYECNLEPLNSKFTAEVIDAKCYNPITQLETMFKSISKACVKRNHKIIDYDRFKSEVTRLEAIQERSASEDQKLRDNNASFAVAKIEFDKINSLLKLELPVVLSMRNKLIEPLFLTLYEYQARLFNELYKSLDSIRHLPVLPKEPLLSFEKQKSHLDALMDKFTLAKAFNSAPLGSVPTPSYASIDNSEYLNALFDFEAIDKNELSFSQGQKIKILEKPDGEWWKGEVNGKQGFFPKNYVQS